MLQRDYILVLLEDFVASVVPRLRLVVRDGDLDAAAEAERDLAGLLDLDASCALALSPESLVTMTRLSGVGETVAGHAACVLDVLARAYARAGMAEVADLRAAQARAMAEAFGWDMSDVPEGLEGLREAPAGGN